LDRDDLDLLLDSADALLRRSGEGDEPDEDALDQALALARRAGKLARSHADREAEAEAAVLEGSALAGIGDPAAALACFEAALRARPGDVDALVEKGAALYELCRFEEARAPLEEAVRAAPKDAWAHHALALVEERLGRAAEAERHFARARKLAPDDFPAPVTLTHAEFEGAVEDALGELPPEVARWLANVAIAVEDLPAPADLLGSDPPLSPSILGLFRGAPLGDKASMDPWSHFPSSIALYQKNLERYARDRDELVDEIRVTLLHEVGHFLGLDHDALERLGLD
jgi:predicted Zn-dependent protease with MMP-like domain/Flp pilus assembly protein TadD